MIEFDGSFKSKTFTLHSGGSQFFNFSNNVGMVGLIIFGTVQEKHRAPQIAPKDKVIFSYSGTVGGEPDLTDDFILLVPEAAPEFTVGLTNAHPGRDQDFRLRVEAVD